MHRRAELEGNLRRKPNPKGAQAGARKRSEESDEAIRAGKRGNARGCEGPLRVKWSTYASTEAEVTRHGSHTESRMRENCTYGSMRGRAYPITRGVPLYSTP